MDGGRGQDVDPLIKLAKAVASAADTSHILANDNQTADIPPGASTHTTAFGSETAVPTGPSLGFSADLVLTKKFSYGSGDPPIIKGLSEQLEEDDGCRSCKRNYMKRKLALKWLSKNVTHHARIREILHLLDRQDLSKLYGMVVKHYEVNPLAGVHMLETFTGKILYMFADTPYPLSVSLMKKMLKHKLEVEIDGVGNDMTHAVQLIKFIKNQLASSVPSA
ncbi:hypothetical protein Tco_0866738 [Tanacetum coccineum]